MVEAAPPVARLGLTAAGAPLSTRSWKLMFGSPLSLKRFGRDVAVYSG
jgi:hypothetical protein